MGCVSSLSLSLCVSVFLSILSADADAERRTQNAGTGMEAMVGSKFKLLRKIGSGAFGEIYQGSVSLDLPILFLFLFMACFASSHPPQAFHRDKRFLHIWKASPNHRTDADDAAVDPMLSFPLNFLHVVGGVLLFH